MIVLKGVCKSFDGGRTFAVRDLSLEVREGELVVLLGESGCGKTTTLKMVNRLVDPSGGSIEVAGKDIMAQDPVALRRTIGYAFQGVGLFPHMTVAGNIGVVPRLLGWSKTDIAARVDELLALSHLAPERFRDRLPGELSGGQRQRVGVARALAARPAIMLMDEPFGALDPITRDALQREYARIHRELGLTTVMVTHDVTEALLMADRVAVLGGGAILQLGAPAEFLARPADDCVRALMQMPRDYADRVRALMEQGREHDPEHGR
jgi:osmoprotectant transport system ATP-binding protein